MKVRLGGKAMGNRRWLAGIVFPIVMLAASTMKIVAADRFPWPFVLQLDQQAPTLVSGTVVNPVGQPVANANVAVFVEHPDFLVPVLSPTVLQQTVADGEGRFSMQFASPTPYQCSRLRAIAGHLNDGFCIKELVLTKREQNVHFRLNNERVIRGRAIGPEGQLVAGLRIHLRYFRDGASSVSLWPADAVPAAWPTSVLTDDVGEFSVRGIPSSKNDVSLTFETGDERYAPQKTNVQTGGDEAVTIRLSAAGIVKGLVVQQDSGAPLGGCWLLVVPTDFKQDADNQHEGFPVRADSEGRFRVLCNRTKYLTIYVYPPEGKPYLAWVTGAQPWPENKLQADLRIEVPRGVLIRGKVVESESKMPVAGAGVEYWVAQEKKPPYVSRDVAKKAYWGAEYRRILSRRDGTFEVVAIPGPGYLLAKAPDATYLSRQITHGEVTGLGPGGYFMNIEAARSINPAPDEKAVDVVMEMQQGVTIRGRVEGPEGKSVDHAVLLSTSFTRVQSTYWYPRRELPVVDGRFELPGCDPNQARTVFFLDANNQLGVTVTLHPKEAREKLSVIRLKPCGSATVQLIDKRGTPIAHQQLLGDQLIVRPDLMGMKGIVNASYGDQPVRHIFWAMSILDPSRHRALSTDKNGLATFPTLIPGAPYKLIQVAPSNKELLDFEVDAGTEKSLGKFTVE
jgi:hypothetical protein